MYSSRGDYCGLAPALEYGISDSKRRLCVFDSVDGVHWTRPELSEVPFGDHKTTNILFRLDQGTAAYSSIMIDPSDRETPYHMYLLREKSSEGRPPAGSGYYRYRSPDGYRWEFVRWSDHGSHEGG